MMKKLKAPSIKGSKTSVMSDARKKMKALRRENPPVMKTGAKTKLKTYTKF